MQTVTAENKTSENKTSKAISENYRDTQAGIYLRLMTHEDTDRIVAWRNSDAVRKNFIYQELFTRRSHEHWIRTHVETGDVVQMIICDLEGDKPLGSVYIRDIDRHHNKAEYGIFIGEESARGRGTLLSLSVPYLPCIKLENLLKAAQSLPAGIVGEPAGDPKL